MRAGPGGITFLVTSKNGSIGSGCFPLLPEQIQGFYLYK